MVVFAQIYKNRYHYLSLPEKNEHCTKPGREARIRVVRPSVYSGRRKKRTNKEIF